MNLSMEILVQDKYSQMNGILRKCDKYSENEKKCKKAKKS